MVLTLGAIVALVGNGPSGPNHVVRQEALGTSSPRTAGFPTSRFPPFVRFALSRAALSGKTPFFWLRKGQQPFNPGVAIIATPSTSGPTTPQANNWAVPGTVIDNLDTAPGSPYKPGQKVVALTFDDGPSPIYTPPVLQILVADHVPASFQIIGEHGAAYPAILRQEAADGMVLVNHTWTHVDLVRLPASGWPGEVDQTDALLQGVTGHPVRCLRPPSGHSDAAVVAQLGQRGLADLYWDVDPSDYLMPGASVIARACAFRAPSRRHRGPA